MSDTFYTTTHGDTRAQALDAAKMQAAIYFVDEPFEVSHFSAELRGGRYRLEACFERVPEELNFLDDCRDAVALLDVIAPDDAEVLHEYLNGGRP